MRRERERLKGLNARAREERCALVAALAGGGRLPALLLLNLARRDTEKPVLLPAMAVAVVGGDEDTPMAAYLNLTAASGGGGSGGNDGDGAAAAARNGAPGAEDEAGEEGGAGGVGAPRGAAAGGAAPQSAAAAAGLSGLPQPLLFCLGADNRLMVVSATHVVGACADATLAGELSQQYAATWAALAGGWRSAVEDPRAWKNHSGGGRLGALGWGARPNRSGAWSTSAHGRVLLRAAAAGQGACARVLGPEQLRSLRAA